MPTTVRCSRQKTGKWRRRQGEAKGWNAGDVPAWESRPIHERWRNRGHTASLRTRKAGPERMFRGKSPSTMPPQRADTCIHHVRDGSQNLCSNDPQLIVRQQIVEFFLEDPTVAVRDWNFNRRRGKNCGNLMTWAARVPPPRWRISLKHPTRIKFWISWSHSIFIHGRNIFMQKQLPPAFSNSEVSTITGFSPSSWRMASNCVVM